MLEVKSAVKPCSVHPHTAITPRSEGGAMRGVKRTTKQKQLVELFGLN